MSLAPIPTAPAGVPVGAALWSATAWLGAPVGLTVPRWAALTVGALIVVAALQGRRKLYRLPWWGLAAGGAGLALWGAAGSGRS